MVQPRPFRFGAGFFGAPSREAWVSLARRTEELGYSTFLIPDHFQPQLAPLTALMAAADATRTLRVGCFVFDNDFRHPAALAKEVATLDLLSGGRFEFGMGAGWAAADYERTGIPFDPPAVRISRLAEALHIMKGLFADEPVTFSGTHYTVAGLEGFPKPLQRPHPPVLIGGSRKELLSLAAREADIISLLGSTGPAQHDLADHTGAATARRVEWIKQAAGDRFSALELNTFVFEVVITADRQGAANQLAAAYGMTSQDVLASLHFLVGTVDDVIEELTSWRAQFGISYVAVFGEASMEAFAPVVALLAGT